MSDNLFDRFRDRITDLNAPVAISAAGDVMRYGDLIARSGQMAAALVGLGVKPDDRVTVQVEKSLDALVLYLATLRAGAIFMPLNTAYTTAEVDYFLQDARPRLFICDPARADDLAAIGAQAGARIVTLDASGQGSLIDESQSYSSDFQTIARGCDDLAALLYTSGTTGRSKGAMLSHGNLISNALTLREAWHYEPKDVLIHALPIFHTHGLFVACNVTLFSGASMHFLPKFDADAVLERLSKATVLMGVPTFYVRLLEDARLTAALCSGMRLFISGSAPLLSETHKRWQERTGHAILERYGMTETNMNSSNPYEAARIAGTVGLPLAGTEIIITDPASGAPLPQGDIGMIEIRGPNVFKGYWGMPEKTAAELRENGFFISGDLGRFDAQGYLHIVGRGKDLIITGGYNVYPKEVETEIDAMEGVVESAVIGLPDVYFGEAVTAVVVAKTGADLSEDQVMAHLRQRLAKFKQPKRIVFLEDLPRNTMGKVQKNLLRQMFAEA